MADSESVKNPGSITPNSDGSDLQAKLESLKRGRQALEAQWKLNLAFYKGKQYTYYNKSLRRLETLPVEDGEKPRYRVRLVNDQISPNANALLAKLTKTKPVINATATSGKDKDIKAAQLADQLLEDWWLDLNLDDKLGEALMWAIITGQGYWKILWDKDAGESMRFILDPQGQPVLDSTLEDLFRAELGKVGIQAQDMVVYMGDIKVEVPSPFDVYIDDTAKVFDEAKYAICVHYMGVDEIKKKWGKDFTPDAIATTSDSAMPMGSTYQANEPNMKAVNVGYFLPTPTIPNGRYVTWIDDQIVEDQAWPYPFKKLPLVKFPGIRVPGQVYDMGDVEKAIPIQKDLNKTLSQVIEYKNLTLKPRVWAPTGSMNGVRLTSEPGALYEYNPIGDHKPEVEQLPSLPPYVFEHLNELRNDIKSAFSLVDIAEGTPPPNVEAGIAIDLLQEMATDRIAPRVLMMERTLVKAGEIMLAYAQTYYKEPRLVKAGGPQKARRFTQADIQGGISIHVETGSALPRTRAGRQQRILDYVDRGVIRPDQAYKYLDIADLEGLAAKFAADEDQAYREHDKILAGMPVNEVAAANAQQAIEQGLPVADGPPITDPQAAQEYIHAQGLEPLPFENYSAHLDVHGLFLKSQEFEALPIQNKQDFLTHYNATLKALSSVPPTVEGKAPTVSLAIKSTAGPTATAEILNKAGIANVTKADLEEPPLETWVTDSLDKIDQDEAGNDPLTPMDMQLKAVETQAKLNDAMIRSGTAAQSMQHAQEKHQMAQDAHEQKLAMQRDAHMSDQHHKAQAHGEKLRQSKAQGAERIKQMRKPKPKAGK